MQQDDLVLSDVHVDSQTSLENSSTATYFQYKFDPNDEETINEDSDGDLVIPRQDNQHELRCIKIKHAMATNLLDVGQQVWLGALVMCDFVYENSNLFHEKDALELGCGVGLTAIALSRVAKFVTCTDCNSEALNYCQQNLDNNNITNVYVKMLDWENMNDTKLDKTKWPNILVACDCIYSNVLTKSLFDVLFRIVTSSNLFANAHEHLNKQEIYISLEKRINFTLPECRVTNIEYDFFQECLQLFQKKCLERSKICMIENIDLSDIPKNFVYNRNEQLEIWKIIVNHTSSI